MKAASLSDFELLDNWRQGDNRAGNELFERYFGQLYRFFGNQRGYPCPGDLAGTAGNRAL